MWRRVAVTGAGGFLGGHLLAQLRSRCPRTEVLAVGPPATSGAAGGEPFGDLPPCEVVFHLGGAAGIEPSLADPASDLTRNALGTLLLLESLRRMPGVRVILASSAAVYGRAEGRVSEEQPPQPISPYGVSKLAAEGYVRVYGELHGVTACIARIGNVYGPGQRRLAIHDLARRAVEQPPPLVLHGTGEEVRDFVHAADVARALLVIARRGTPGEAYNVASGTGVALREVAGLVARAAGLAPDAVVADRVPRPGQVDRFQPVVDKLFALGYRPSVELASGIAETVAWVRST